VFLFAPLGLGENKKETSHIFINATNSNEKKSITSDNMWRCFGNYFSNAKRLRENPTS
jgi:hypothetical protein